MRVAIVSPGAMGSAIGRRLIDCGASVVTCVMGRSDRTVRAAEEHGIECRSSYEDMVADADLILSITPPAQARTVASVISRALEAQTSPATYVDCNAISPATARAIADLVSRAGTRFIDACIVGEPPAGIRSPRVYASGPDIGPLRRLADYGLDVRDAGTEIGRASGLKLCYAAVTKGLTGLAVEMYALANTLDLGELLDAELAQSVPELARLFERWLPPMPAKASRWVGEMQELAATVRAAGLPDGPFNGLAEVFARVGHRFQDTGLPDGVPSTAVARLLEPPSNSPPTSGL